MRYKGVHDPAKRNAGLASMDDSETFRFGSFHLVPAQRELLLNGVPVALGSRAFDLLLALIQRRGQLASKDELLAEVWPQTVVEENNLQAQISALRKVLARDLTGACILQTVPGRGYRFLPKIEHGQPADATADTTVPIRSDAAALPLPDRPSIAVLPFDNMSGDPQQEFFSDGITEDITAALCKLSGFFVIARNTMFTYKGRPSDVRVIGRELGVRYVLEGSVRKAGHQIRVTAQLLDADTGNHLWAERYDGNLEDIFAIQDEITTSIVGRIGPELLAAEHLRISRRPPHSLNAWECVIRALFLSSQQSEEASRAALVLLEQALIYDPDYTQALGMKAWIMVFRAFQGWEEMGQVLMQVRPIIAQAMAADDDELWPYLAEGMVGYATRDNGLAMRALTRAVALSPNSVNAHGLLGNAHSFGGRSDEAIAYIDHAVRLSPRDTFLSDFQLYYCFAHFQGARYELALRYAQQAHRMRPGHPYPLLLGAACAGHLGDAQTGASLMRELKAILPIISAPWIEATSPYVHREDRARLIEGLSRAGL